jgi:hypothetical protein
MRRKLLCIITAISSITAMSQPVLTYENLKLELGKKYSFSGTDQIVHPGDSGENIVWDFSHLYEQTLVDYIVSESDSNFPQANFNIKSEGNSSSYIFEDSNSRYTHGFHIQLYDLTIEYDNPPLSMLYPLEYGNIRHDTFSGHYEYSGINYTTKGNAFYRCDAYGIITTPDNTYSNAIRVYTKQTVRDSSATIDMSVESETYAWYIEGYPMPIFSIQIGVNSMGTFYNTTYLKDPTINIHKIDQTAFNYTLYPNPSADILNLEVDPTFSISKLEIVDLSGKQLQNIKLNNASDSGKLKIDVSELSNGIYFLRMTTSEGVRSAKFTVSK